MALRGTGAFAGWYPLEFILVFALVLPVTPLVEGAGTGTGLSVAIILVCIVYAAVNAVLVYIVMVFLLSCMKRS